MNESNVARKMTSKQNMQYRYSAAKYLIFPTMDEKPVYSQSRGKERLAKTQTLAFHSGTRTS